MPRPKTVGECWDVFERAGMPRWPAVGRAGEHLFPAAERLAAILDETDRLRHDLATMTLSAEMACHEPPGGCECPGCMLAAERFAEPADG